MHPYSKDTTLITALKADLNVKVKTQSEVA